MKPRLSLPICSNTISPRLVTFRLPQCQSYRPISTTTTLNADPRPSGTPPQNPTRNKSLDDIANLMFPNSLSPPPAKNSDLADLASSVAPSKRSTRPADPHHLHIYAHKHNTHITLTRPNRNPLISVSTGNLNFRKAQRGTYDAAYQLGKYVMERIQQQGLLKEIENLEVVLRDFGPGREALTKVLLGSEGRPLRGRVTKVADATRIKFGGTRGEKPRRLG